MGNNQETYNSDKRMGEAWKREFSKCICETINNYILPHKLKFSLGQLDWVSHAMLRTSTFFCRSMIPKSCSWASDGLSLNFHWTEEK